jgi:hypothetical protein
VVPEIVTGITLTPLNTVVPAVADTPVLVGAVANPNCTAHKEVAQMLVADILVAVSRVADTLVALMVVVALMLTADKSPVA